MAGAGRELIWRLYEQFKADGLEVSISRLCAWFGVARRSVYYRQHRKQPVVKECYSEPIKQLIAVMVCSKNSSRRIAHNKMAWWKG